MRPSAAALGLFLKSVLAIPRDETTASSSSVISLPGGGTVTVPAGYTPTPPVPLPKYMVDNQHNYFHAAPDKYNPNLVKVRPSPQISGPRLANRSENDWSSGKRQSSGSSYWLANIGHGSFPYAPSGYPVWRNVKDYGAKGDGVTDDTEAIQNAATDGGRCGQDCGSTSVLGAVVFFPPGTYMVSSPIIQYYFTQFIGDPTNKPTIKGLPTFKGIALIDTDVYIPGGNGSEWYINQNQFFRQIRNFVIDLTAMPNNNTSGDQTYVPCGIHWQVAQSTSLQNIDVVMPLGGGTTAVGIFTENGSGGFMSDLTFFGGNIAMRVGSQQFTARHITITLPATAVSMIWDWGWTWQDIYVNSAFVAFDCTNFGGDGSQGTGSLTVIDSHFNAVPFAIPVNRDKRPAITIENLLIEGNTPSVVLVSGGETILAGVTGGSATIRSWAMGPRYTDLDGSGSYVTGDISPAPSKPAVLLDGGSGKFFTRSKPQYENLGADSFISVADFGATGDGTGDQSGAINNALAAANGRIVFFPAGVYPVAFTVNVPVGSRIVGEAWPQIQGWGNTFGDAYNPQPVVKVGNAGDVGDVEISDMLFTTRGPTPGAVGVEWNVREASQGSAAMWDSHVRIGGTVGSDLQFSDCPASSSVASSCFGASLMMHITSGASGYFENNWLWTADHDLDIPAQSQVNVFTGRGLLVETNGPVWLWGGAVEHATLYQYNFYKASNIYAGHIQTESPYYQPTPNAAEVFPLGVYASDPDFADCNPSDDQCLFAWALMIQNSTDVLIYGAGLYSWFQSYGQGCLAGEDCQQRLVLTTYSQHVWIFSEYTKGATECVSPLGGINAALQKDNQNGYLTAISAWLVLAVTGANIGGYANVGDNPTPDNLLPVGNLSDACGNIQCGQTMTLSAPCASAIRSLPTSGANNNPPGPDNCQETCDLYRLITGTCCGTGGSACFGIAVPGSQELPAPLPVTSGFKPPASATWSAPGIDSTGSPTTTSYDSEHTNDHDIWLPPLWIPVPAGGPPLVVPPPVDMPDNDPDGWLFIADEFDANSWEDSDPVPAPTPSTPVSPTTSTTSSYTPPPTGAFGVLIPSGGNVDCHTDVDYTDLAPCYASAFNRFDAGTVYSSDENLCFGQGSVVLDGVEIGGYCVLFSTPGCSLVWGIADSFGITPIYKFTGAELQDFLSAAQSNCGNGPAAAIRTTDKDPDDTSLGWSMSFCLVHDGQEAACGTNQGFPNP
ncbi:hypothetical protein VTK56DRAFT_5338 [Thermocarpiscus australiensis]